ncbi:serine hydrolase domain-containing protein [Streptomyces melanogenes]|uniref:serine hydrolase domain-containing protein n=1 Tax=Streptomyces melanogenes TaxID=67326 RepID=UPI0037B24D85
MRTTLVATALVLALGGAATPAVAAPPAPHSTTAQPGLPALLAQLPNGNATAALVRVGGTQGTFTGSGGVHDLKTQNPADPRARFRVGSVTKVFTAAVVLQLAGEGRVDLDRSVRAYLPELIPASYQHVTVRQLLNHTSGIPSYDSGSGDTLDAWYAHRFDRHDPAAMVRQATSQKRLFEPGTQQKYDNIGYTVAGLLIEKVTHDSYAHQVQRRILKPLGLRDSYFPGADPTIHGPHNHGYQEFVKADGTKELRDVTIWGATEAFAAGDLISTTADLETFLRSLFRGEVVRGPLLKEMFTTPGPNVHLYGTDEPSAYSAGLETMELGGRQVWGKTGGRWGYNAVIAATPDLSRTLVYSVNSTDAKGKDMNPTALTIVATTFGPPTHH